MLEAEAIERMADAKKYEQIALAQGQKEAMENINEAALNSSVGAEFLLASERIKAFAELAKNGQTDKILVPYETSKLIGSLSVFKEFLSLKNSENSNKIVKNLNQNNSSRFSENSSLKSES